MEKLKKGDKVRVLKAYDGKCPPGVGEVIEEEDYGRVLVYFHGWGIGHHRGNSCWFIPARAEYLEHVRERSKFEPGDQVVRINCSNGACAQVGQKATVTFYDKSHNMVYVTYPGHSNEKHGGEGWMAYNTELIDACDSNPITFKAGDCGTTRDGRKYKVVAVRTTPGLIDVDLDGKLVNGHCYLNGKTFSDGREGKGDLLPPTSRDVDNTPMFKPGDRVRVTRTAETRENGWLNSWVKSMDDAIGKEFEVVRTIDAGVYFKNRSEGFPPFVLELVKAETTTDINPATSEDKYMLKIEDRTYIDGVNASEYSDDQLIKKISEAENEIAKLKTIGTKSAKVEARIAELDAGAQRLASILDARS